MQASRSLVGGPEPLDVALSELSVLGRHAFDALPPHFKAAALHELAHQRPDVVFFQSKLPFNRFKGRSVFPGHLDDPVYVVLWPLFPRHIGALFAFGGKVWIAGHASLTTTPLILFMGHA